MSDASSPSEAIQVILTAAFLHRYLKPLIRTTRQTVQKLKTSPRGGNQILGFLLRSHHREIDLRSTLDRVVRRYEDISDFRKGFENVKC